VSAYFEEFFRADIYKRNQGRIVRQVTFAALALTLLIGLWRLVLMLRGYTCPEWISPGLWPWLCHGLPGLLAVAGLWAAYRSVNLPAFADFLIAVEAEMNKVSWPSRGELIRWSLVVIVMIFAIGLLLAAFDFCWVWFFKFIGVYSA
jgi:preprotein translocase subunit SecE